jgi:hypothetical protein
VAIAAKACGGDGSGGGGVFVSKNAAKNCSHVSEGLKDGLGQTELTLGGVDGMSSQLRASWREFSAH